MLQQHPWQAHSRRMLWALLASAALHALVWRASSVGAPGPAPAGLIWHLRDPATGDALVPSSHPTPDTMTQLRGAITDVPSTASAAPAGDARPPAPAHADAPASNRNNTAATIPPRDPAALFHWPAPAPEPVSALHDPIQAAMAAQTRQYRAMALHQALGELSGQLAQHLNGRHVCRLQADQQILCDLPADLSWNALLIGWLSLALQEQGLGLGDGAPSLQGQDGSLQLQLQPARVDP